MEPPALETLGPHRKAGSVPVHDADAIASLGEKHIKVPAQGVLGERAAHDRGEAVDSFPPIDRLRRDENPNARRQTQHERASSTMIRSCRSAVPSNDAGT